MAHRNKVMRSINRDDGQLCVDIFRRPDGTFGFEEYRRDPEDLGGWYPVGNHAGHSFPTQDTALEAARRTVAWLA